MKGFIEARRVCLTGFNDDLQLHDTWQLTPTAKYARSPDRPTFEMSRHCRLQP